MAVEHNEPGAGTVQTARRWIGDSWMGWAALYAILMVLDRFYGG